MSDDPRLAALGKFTPEQHLTPGYGDGYLFFAGRDDVHGILLALLTAERMGLKFNMFGYDDDRLNDAIMTLLADPNVAVQATLDSSQEGGVHERKIIASDLLVRPDLYNSFAILRSPTGQIAHTKGGVLISQGLWFEGSTNWSASGEGTGISLDPAVKPAKGYVAQNNTLLVSANAVGLIRFGARLDVEHREGLRHTAAA
jgi:hypothetical protein